MAVHIVTSPGLAAIFKPYRTMSRYLKSLGLAFAATLTAHAATTIPLPLVSSRPTNASQVLDPRLASFSLEFSYVTAFGGNKTHPNVLTRELMQRLAERTGAGPVSDLILAFAVELTSNRTYDLAVSRCRPLACLSLVFRDTTVSYSDL